MAIESETFDGKRYREVKGLATRENGLHCCDGCAARKGGKHNTALCNALPPCHSGMVFEEVE